MIIRKGAGKENDIGEGKEITLDMLKEWSGKCDIFVKEIDDTTDNEVFTSLCNGEKIIRKQTQYMQENVE